MTYETIRHGEHAGYIAHKRSGVPMCDDCLIAGRRARKAMEVRLARGVRSRVPLGPAAWKVLADQSITVIANETGLNRNNLYQAYAKGPDGIVLATTRAKILACRSWTRQGIQRRLQALYAIGWNSEALAAHSGLSSTGIRSARRREIQYLDPDFALQLVELYDDLHMSPLDPTHDKTVSRSINDAHRRGWVPPLAWDDIDNDAAPAAPVADAGQVDHAVIQRAFDGDTSIVMNPAERREFVKQWLTAGRTTRTLDEEYGINPWREVKSLKAAESEAA